MPPPPPQPSPTVGFFSIISPCFLDKVLNDLLMFSNWTEINNSLVHDCVMYQKSYTFESIKFISRTHLRFSVWYNESQADMCLILPPPHPRLLVALWRWASVWCKQASTSVICLCVWGGRWEVRLLDEGREFLEPNPLIDGLNWVGRCSLKRGVCGRCLPSTVCCLIDPHRWWSKKSC